MKKRNVAVAMAAMTMATSVAPVVANAAQKTAGLVDNSNSESFVIENQEAKKLVNEVKVLLDKKSDETPANPLYTVYTNVKIKTEGNREVLELANSGENNKIFIDGNKNEGRFVYGNKIDTSKDLSKILELASDNSNFKTEGTELEVTIVDNGFKTINGDIVTSIVSTYNENNLPSSDIEKIKEKINELDSNSGKYLVKDDSIGTADLTMKLRNEVYDIKSNDANEIIVDVYADLKENVESKDGVKLEKVNVWDVKNEKRGTKGDSQNVSVNSNQVTVEGIKNGKVYKEAIIKPISGYTIEVEKNGVVTTIADKEYKFTEAGEYKLNVKDSSNNKSSEVVFTVKPEETVNRAKTSFIIKKGDKKIDTDNLKVLLSNGDEKRLNNLFTTGDTSSDYKLDIMSKIKGFKKQDSKRDDIPAKELAKVRVTNNNLKELDSSKLFDGMMLTDKGVELLNSLNTKKTEDGVTTTVTISDIDEVKEVVKNREYKLGFTVNKTETEPKAKANDEVNVLSNEDFELTITSDKEETLDKLKTVLEDVQSAKPNEGVTSIQGIRGLMGRTRFETAIEVSKELYPANDSTDSAKSIVLVQKDAVVDGLAATPLAHMVKAPVLFTDTTSVPTNVVSEIKRALNIKATAVGDLKDKVIYVVGGTTVIEPAVEDQLKELGVTVKRIEGANRMETSVSIAEEMKAVAKKDSKINLSDKAFVVGRNGEADAMSIAGYAADKNSPIIVADTEELTKSAVEFIEDEMKTADIIGGETVVKEEIKDSLVEILDGKKANVERVDGLRRSETNANVINKYYKASQYENVYVAKNGQGNATELVDSLVAGPLAAKNHAPVVLATNDLSEEQLDVLETRLSGNESLVQVGGGVARSVIEKIAVKIGLIK